MFFMIAKIYDTLAKNYAKQGWWPLYNVKTGRFEYHKGDYNLPKTDAQRFEICLGAILTQNTSWKNVQKAMLEMKKRNLLDKDAIKNSNEKDLADAIKSSGYHNQKAKKLKKIVEFIESGKEFNRENLLGVWGVGKETADSILLYAYKKPTFVIDAYTRRIMTRIYKKDFDYDDLQKLFMKELEHDFKKFNEYHALLVEHAKRHCKKEPNCRECSLKRDCKSCVLLE